jgi:hypothetical protein
MRLAQSGRPEAFQMFIAKIDEGRETVEDLESKASLFLTQDAVVLERS